MFIRLNRFAEELEPEAMKQAKREDQKLGDASPQSRQSGYEFRTLACGKASENARAHMHFSNLSRLCISCQTVSVATRTRLVGPLPS